MQDESKTAASETVAYSSRDQVPQKYKWNLTLWFPSDEACLASLGECQSLPEEYAAWQDRATATAAGLLGFLRFDDEATSKLQRVWEYLERRGDEDTRINRWQDLVGQVHALAARVGAAAAWFQPALLALDHATLDAWYAQEPDLALYRRALQKMRALRDHVLSPAEEALLAQAGELAAAPEREFSMLNEADMAFPDALDSQGQPHTVTHGNFTAVLEVSPDRTLRQNAYHSVYGAYRKVKNTSAAILGAQMKSLEFFARARHYGSSLEASLAPTEVPVSVYSGLIQAVHANVEPMHRYMALRAHRLGLEQMRYWDVYLPTVQAPEHHYTFEEACDIMLAALAPLGQDYLAVVRQAISDRWYDVYETPGKRSGAYSCGGRGIAPLILLNWQGSLEDLFVLAHETGHSLHTWLSSHSQPVRYSEYEMFVAEVASTTNEMLLLQYLLDHAASVQERAFLLDHWCSQFKNALYRQTLFAEFERDANEASARGEGTGADALSERYGKLNELYYGPALKVDDDISLEWARIPHFYYNYYVYVYATSFAAAVALAERILKGGAPARDAYLGFLRGGCSKPPLDLLAGAGVDMANGAAVDEALKRFAALVDELEGLL